MNFFLDIRTLSIVVGVTIFVLGLSMVYHICSRKTYSGFGLWTAGIILMGVTFFLIAFRHLLPVFITVIMANGMAFTSLALFYLGFTTMAENPLKLYFHFGIGLPIFLILFSFFTFISPNVNARISLISFVGAFYFFLCIWAMLKNTLYEQGGLNKMLTATLIAFCVLFACRGVFFLLPGSTITDFMSTGIFHQTVLLTLMGLAIFFVFGLLQLNSQMLERELYRDQEGLRESEERYRLLVEQSLQGLVIAQDNPVRLSFVNKRMEAITGYRQDELQHFGPNQLVALIHSKDRERFFRNFRARLSGEAIQPLQEFRIVHKTEGTRWVELYSSRIVYKNAPATHTIFLDITEKKRAQEALRESDEKLARSEKMEAMELMAGGVAHDLNNILSGIVSYPELLLMDLPEASPLRNPIKTIQESGMRAADIAEDLLTIARGVAKGNEVLNLNAVIEEYLDSAEHLKLEKFHPLTVFKTELNPELLNITGSASHLNKILMNLILNASEAIKGEGTVTISTANRYLDEPLKGYEDVHIGEYTILTVSDDGSGISPEDLKRIFEPFYTKKVMGRSGTGLGLAIVWNTVQDHKGYINVKNSEKGTVFELFFPVTREEVADKREQVPLENYLGHGEKILVVDDEERQREIASGVLTRLGYMVETVAGGEAAVEYVKEHPSISSSLIWSCQKGSTGGRLMRR